MATRAVSWNYAAYVPDREKGGACISGTFVVDPWVCPYTTQMNPFYDSIYANISWVKEDGGFADFNARVRAGFDEQGTTLVDSFDRTYAFTVMVPIGTFYEKTFSKGYATEDYYPYNKITGTDCFVVRRLSLYSPFASLAKWGTYYWLAASFDVAGTAARLVQFSEGYISGGVNPKYILVSKCDTTNLGIRTIGAETLPAVAFSDYVKSYELGSNPNASFGFTVDAESTYNKKLDTVSTDGFIHASSTPSILGIPVTFPIGTNIPAFKTRAGQVFARHSYNRLISRRFGPGLIYAPPQPLIEIKGYVSPYTSVPYAQLNTSSAYGTTDYGCVMRRTFQFLVRKIKQVPCMATLAQIDPLVSCSVPVAVAELTHPTLKHWVITDSYSFSLTVDLKCIGNVYKAFWNLGVIETHLPVPYVRRIAIQYWSLTGSTGCRLSGPSRILAASAQAALNTLTFSSFGTFDQRMSGPTTRNHKLAQGDGEVDFNSTFHIDQVYTGTKQIHAAITFNSVGSMTAFDVTIDPLTDAADETSRYAAWLGS